MALLQVQESVQGNVGGVVSGATGLTGALAGLSRHLLQGPPPPVTGQAVTALTDGGNVGLGAVTGLLNTLQLVPSPPARYLLQETPPPATGDAELFDTASALPVPPTCLLVACCMPLACTSDVANVCALWDPA